METRHRVINTQDIQQDETSTHFMGLSEAGWNTVSMLVYHGLRTKDFYVEVLLDLRKWKEINHVKI